MSALFDNIIDSIADNFDHADPRASIEKAFKQGAEAAGILDQIFAEDAELLSEVRRLVFPELYAETNDELQGRIGQASKLLDEIETPWPEDIERIKGILNG